MERACSKEVVKEGWESSMDTSNDVSWFQRNYNCSFCKREFNSAQALGGHMNVHRRDRARLRLQLPSLILDHAPNPKPNRNVSSSSVTLSSPTYLSYYSSHLSSVPSKTLSPSFTSQKRSPIASEVKETKSMKEAKPHKYYKPDDSFERSGGHEAFSLDLERMSKEPAEVLLDLELRLGH